MSLLSSISLARLGGFKNYEGLHVSREQLRGRLRKDELYIARVQCSLGETEKLLATLITFFFSPIIRVPILTRQTLPIYLKLTKAMYLPAL